MKKTIYPLSKLVIIEGQYFSVRGIHTYKDFLKHLELLELSKGLIQVSESIELINISNTNTKVSLLQFGDKLELVETKFFNRY